MLKLYHLFLNRALETNLNISYMKERIFYLVFSSFSFRHTPCLLYNFGLLYTLANTKWWF